MNNDVIEMHSTWLAINSIVGCTNGCKYCFLQTKNENLIKPRIIVDEQTAIKQLLESKYYNSTIPICLLPNTDAFLNKKNIQYLKNLLFEIKKNKIKNILTIVTKCGIEESFIRYINELKMNKQIVIYLSYSGLGKTIEPNVDIEKIKKNFALLFENKIKFIHYFRPLIPSNSKKEKIDEILNYVSGYTKYSVITGLKLKEEYFDKIDFWNEIKKHKKEAIDAEGVWINDAFDYFYNNYNRKHYVFQTNACALSNVLKQPNLEYYNSYECKNYNICSKMQRNRCKISYVFNKINLKNRVVRELKKLNKYDEKVIIKISDKIVIENLDLNVSDLAYLTYMCHKKVITNRRNKSDKYFNSSLNGSKPLVLHN